MRNIFLVVLAVLWATSAHAQILFEENFNELTDWVVPQIAAGEVTCRQGQTCDTPLPGNFYDYRTAGTEVCSNTDGNHHTLNINGQYPRGGAGKSFLMWNEPCPSRSASWGGDGLLGIAFAPQTEVYISWWAKYSPTWVWNTGSPMQKFLHVSHFSDSDPGTIWNFAGGVQNKPRWAGQFAVYNGDGGRGEWAPQTSPLTAARDSSQSWTDGPNYTGTPGGAGYNGKYLWPGGTNAWTQPGVPGDAEWHQYQVYLKLNTPGVANGIARMWYDGDQIQNRTNITWIPAGDDPNLWAWNHTWIGGNNSNYFTPAAEQYYAVDDVVVSTAFVPLDYVVGVPAMVNGSCGTASGGAFTIQPTANLCASGTATAVAGAGPWTWGCNGANGGTSTAADACTASKTTDFIPPDTIPNKEPGRYTAKLLVALSTEVGATTKYCLTPGCTPVLTYSAPVPVLKNIAYQVLRYSSTDAVSNVETVKELVFRKQRRK
jgi:hypothetical protein